MGGCVSGPKGEFRSESRGAEHIPEACEEAKSLVHALESREIPSSSSVHQFTLAELQDATNGFDPASQIGEGAFGQVFMGELLVSIQKQRSLESLQSGEYASVPRSGDSGEAGPSLLQEREPAEVAREHADDCQPGSQPGARTGGVGQQQQSPQGNDGAAASEEPRDDPPEHAAPAEAPIGNGPAREDLEAPGSRQGGGGAEGSGNEVLGVGREGVGGAKGTERDDTRLLPSAQTFEAEEDPLEGGKRIAQVAIKRILEVNREGFEQFLKEAVVLSRLRHPNLVTLHGVCMEEGAYLVYELMPGGSLDLALEDSREGRLLIDWQNRLKIILAVVDALGYMHSKLFIHRDIKPSNILLDLEFNAKVTDLGMVRVGPNLEIQSIVNTRVMGSNVYIDPTYLNSGNLSFASDVFSFGVVLLELITGVSSLQDVELNNKMIIRLESQEKLSWPCADFVDKKLYRTYCEAQVKKIGVLAVQCVSYVRQDRPTMEEVQRTLHQIAEEVCSNPKCCYHNPDATPKPP